METMLLREETPSDFKEIYRLIKTAFATAKVKDGTEQDFTDRLRASDGYVPELGLVAVEHQRIIGHILLTRQHVDAPGGKKPNVLLLAPLSVILEYRSRGVGRALIKEALRRAKVMGFDAVVLAGDPLYYSRCGFKSITEFGATSTGPIPLQNFLGVEITPGALDQCTLELAE